MLFGLHKNNCFILARANFKELPNSHFVIHDNLQIRENVDSERNAKSPGLVFFCLLKYPGKDENECEVSPEEYKKGPFRFTEFFLEN